MEVRKGDLMIVKKQDCVAYATRKNAVLCRSGIYKYHRQEIAARGFPVDDGKEWYREYRPASVIIAAKDKFPFAAVTNQHTSVDTSPDNYRDQMCGVVGSDVTIKTLDSGDVALMAPIAIYDRNLYNSLEQGMRETSADYVAKVRRVKDSPDYDFILESIQEVNGLAIVPRGRGGSEVRILDSKYTGGVHMAGRIRGLLGTLGIGKKQAAGDFKYSSTVLESVKTLCKTQDAAKIEEIVAKTLEPVAKFPEGDAKDALVGAVQDALENPADVIEKSEDVAKILDGLYEAAVKNETDTTTRVLDGLMGKEPTPPTAAPDMATLIDAAVSKAFDAYVAKNKDSLPGTIDLAVQKALGIKPDAGTTQNKDGLLADYTREDAAFLTRSVFGGN
jgi:hypothetical protein